MPNSNPVVKKKKTREKKRESLCGSSKSYYFSWLTTEGCPLKSLSIVGEGELLGIATVTS
jgi:hypothetical protein